MRKSITILVLLIQCTVSGVLAQDVFPEKDPDSCRAEGVNVMYEVQKDSKGNKKHVYSFAVVNPCFLSSYPYIIIANKPLTQESFQKRDPETVIGYSEFYSYGERAWSMRNHTVVLEEKIDLNDVHIYLCTMREFFPVTIRDPDKVSSAFVLKEWNPDEGWLEFSVDREWTEADILIYNGTDVVSEGVTINDQPSRSGRITLIVSSEQKELIRNSITSFTYVLKVTGEDNSMTYYKIQR